jgi:hypothetical protein
LRSQHGGLAQLARAFDWQSKGQGFDSPNLHLRPLKLYAKADFALRSPENSGRRRASPSFPATPGYGGYCPLYINIMSRIKKVILCCLFIFFCATMIHFIPEKYPYRTPAAFGQNIFRYRDYCLFCKVRNYI